MEKWGECVLEWRRGSFLCGAGLAGGWGAISGRIGVLDGLWERMGLSAEACCRGMLELEELLHRLEILPLVVIKLQLQHSTLPPAINKQ